MLCISGDSEDCFAVRKAILTQAQRLIREGIGQEEFLRLKRSALGRRIRGLVPGGVWGKAPSRFSGGSPNAFSFCSQIKRRELL